MREKQIPTKPKRNEKKKNKQSLIEIFHRSAMIFSVLATFRCRASSRTAKYGFRLSFPQHVLEKGFENPKKIVEIKEKIQLNNSIRI